MKKLSKTQIVIFVALLIISGVILVLALEKPNINNPKINDKIKIDTIDKKAKNNQEQVKKPPKLAKQDIFDNNAIETIKNGEFNKTQDKELASKKEIDNKIPDLSQATIHQQKQQEAIRQIEKQQKPDNMIIYLNSIKNDIEFRELNKEFKYNMKIYKVGDKFNDWYDIEAITDTIIRFRDTDYSYNLRFLKGK